MTNRRAPSAQSKPDTAYPPTYPGLTPTSTGTSKTIPAGVPEVVPDAATGTTEIVPAGVPELVPEPSTASASIVPADVPGLVPDLYPTDAGVPEVVVAEVVPHLCSRCKRELSRVKRRRARPRAQHPGVVIMRPDNHGHGWRVRYWDPSAQREVKVAIQPVLAESADTRLRFAKQLSESLQRLKGDMAASLGRVSQVESITLKAGQQAYWDANPLLAPDTRRSYGIAQAYLVDGRETMLTRDMSLSLFDGARTEMVNRRMPDGEPVTEITINKYIKALRVFLSYLRTTGRLHPDIHSDHIEAALKILSVVHERKAFFAPPEIAQLLDACARYDADNPTQPIGPLVRAWLLTGLRHGEILRVDRAWFNAELPRIEMRAHATKTRILRNVDLSVAPSAFVGVDPAQPGLVFEGWTPDKVYAARDATVALYGAPEWSPQLLRRTCASYFTCAFGAARSARSLGHTIDVADKHYVGAVAIPPGAVTLEQAMRLEPVPVPSAT